METYKIKLNEKELYCLIAALTTYEVEIIEMLKIVNNENTRNDLETRYLEASKLRKKLNNPPF